MSVEKEDLKVSKELIESLENYIDKEECEMLAYTIDGIENIIKRIKEKYPILNDCKCPKCNTKLIENCTQLVKDYCPKCKGILVYVIDTKTGKGVSRFFNELIGNKKMSDNIKIGDNPKLDILVKRESLFCLQLWKDTLRKGSHKDQICIEEIGRSLNNYLNMKSSINKKEDKKN